MSRHSSFSRSSTPRHWRSPAKPADAQASVSLVFAEPEQPLSSGSAAATLLPRQQSGDTDVIEEPSLNKLDRPDAASSLRRASYASLRKRAKDSPGPGDPENAEAASANPNSEAEITSSYSPDPTGPNQISTPAHSPNCKKASRQAPQRTGWFSSLGRKSQIAPMDPEVPTLLVQQAGSQEEPLNIELPPQTTVQTTTSDSTQSPGVAIPFPTSAPEPATEVTEIKSKSASGGSWFSSKPVSQVVPVPTSIPDPTSRGGQSLSETPKLTPPSNGVIPAFSPPQDIPQHSKSAGWFTVAGPSASRRLSPPSNASVLSSVDDSVPILSLLSPTSSPPPLPPVRPRERTHSNLSSLNPSSSRFILSMPLLGRPKVPLGQAVAQAERAGSAIELPHGATASTPSETEKFENKQEGNETRPNLPPEIDSWWGYVGFKSPSSAALPPDSPASTVDSHPSTLDSPSGAETPNSPGLQATEPAPVASSVMSTESASTWYTPWRWYGGTAVSTVSEPAGSGKTQAELVKEEALARSETPTLGSPLPTEPSNPIMADAENRASWVSFFSSRSVSSVNVKTIKEKGEVMEIMNLDDDDSAPLPLRTSRTDAAPDKKASPPPSSKQSQEPPMESPIAPPLTKDDDLKNQAAQRPSSPSSKKSVPPTPPRRTNLVLPTFEDTFGTPPRSIPIPKGASTIRRTIRYMSELLFPEEGKPGKGKGKDSEREILGQELPRTWGVLGDEQAIFGGLKDMKRVVVIGIHGWFPGSIIRQVLGEPTGTSRKFANMLASAVEDYFTEHGGTLEKLTQIVLEGEGTIERRVNSLYQEYLNHQDWVEDLQKADGILLATHSQGSIVTTQLLSRLISEGHIRTPKSLDDATSTYIAGGGVALPKPDIYAAVPQRVCCLAMCGIHLGPLLYLNTSSLVNPYIQYFESAAARELFEFQDSESSVSQTYVKALSDVLEHGIKFTYIASMNDQVVPIYSGSFSTAAHPLILRALYIDGDAYNSSDFLSNLLVLLFRIRNAGLDDGGLITHLSEATAGSLSGVGHSSAYEEPATYALAVSFLFGTSGAVGVHPELDIQPFTARAARNDYEIPWALRDLIANPDVASLFASEFSELRAAFDDWHPRTTVLREIRRKLEPIRRLPMSRL